MGFPQTIPHAEAHVWATLIPARSPEFKVHRTEGLANSAMGQRGPYESFAKYELVDGEWHLRFSYEPRKNCDRCGKDFSSMQYGLGRRNDSTFTGPAYLAPVICDQCHYSDLDTRRAAQREKSEREQLERLKAKYE